MIKIFFRRVTILLKRKKNARKIGIDFTRASNWRLPDKILINKKFADLDLVNDVATSTAFVDIFLDDTYGLQFFKSHLRNITKIIDIGANQGLFILAARNMFPNANIHSYEPNVIILKKLEHHANIAHSEYFNEAVGLVEGRISLDHGLDSLHGKTYLDKAGTIRQRSIKDSIEKMGGEIDLLKLDCEGAEWEILKDVESLQKVKGITLEYHLDSAHDHKSILGVLKNADFKIMHYKIDGPTWGIAWAINNKYVNK